MRYSFRFESLLRIRRHEQDQEQLKLSELLGRWRSAEEALDRLMKESAAADGREVGVKDIRIGHAHRVGLLKRIWKLERMLVHLDKEIEKQREVLLQCSRKTRMLEKLESHARLKFAEHHHHREQVRLNEIATQMYNREQS